MTFSVRLSLLIVVIFQPANAINYLSEMRQFVQNLSAWGRLQNPRLIVVPQNGYPLITENGKPNGPLAETFLNIVNGWGIESLFYGYPTDNKKTPVRVTNEEISFLRRISRISNKPIKVMVTDYCSAPTNMADSYTKSSQNGFISFAATRRDLDVIPNYPIRNENPNNIDNLISAQNFLYLINAKFRSSADMAKAVANTNYDVVIVDKDFITNADIPAMRLKKNGGRRIILAYISVAAAEDWRDYWQKGWAPGKPGSPAWLDAEIGDWPGNFFVKYWMKEWQDIIFGNAKSDLQGIINVGFDGIYMDGMDVAEHFRSSSANSNLPGVKVEPKISAVNIGNVVDLNCEGLASALGGSPVQWLKNGVPVPGGNSQHLQLTNLAGDVAAEYTCQIKPIGTPDWIKSRPVVPKNVPGFKPSKNEVSSKPVVQPSSTVLVPGEPQTLNCAPPPGAQPQSNAYEWYKNGQKIGGSGSKITFNADTTSDGDYSCAYQLPGTNGFVNSLPVPLKTLADPTIAIATNDGQIISDPSLVPSGSPVTLKCDTGGAAGAVQWLKDGVKIGDGQVITISGGASAKGNYDCNFTPRGVNKRIKSKTLKVNPKNPNQQSSTPSNSPIATTKPPGNNFSNFFAKLFPGGHGRV